MLLKEARQILNKMAKEINEAIGKEYLLGEFLSWPQQAMAIMSCIEVAGNVGIDFKEVSNGPLTKCKIIRRTIETHSDMIKLLQDNKIKLEELYDAL